MTTVTKLVRCTTHNEAACWVQLNGNHISRRACRCTADEPPYQCPIDGHALRFLAANPEWGGGFAGTRLLLRSAVR